MDVSFIEQTWVNSGERQSVGQSSKVFYVKTECKDLSGKSKSVKGKIGAYGEITPEDARKKAPEFLQKLRSGKPVIEGKIPTIQDLYDRYLKDKPLAPTTATQYRLCVLTKFKDWMPLDLVQAMQVLKPDVVIERYTDVLNTAGKGMAGNSFKCLQAIFKYGSILYPQFQTSLQIVFFPFVICACHPEAAFYGMSAR